jgi:ABC-type sugar transport system ATPase subunit
MQGIVKAFPGVVALQGVDLSLFRGEVLAVLGENGAGKSTLMKILGGSFQPDSGTITVGSLSNRTFRNPHESRQAGIAVIHQEFNLIPSLNAIENIFLGQDISSYGVIDHNREKKRAVEILQQLGATIDLDLPCKDLTTAQQQLVEIARALVFDAQVIVMDEPTATLTEHEVQRLFNVVRDLQTRKISIIYISHRLEEIFALADRVMVLRDGCTITTRQCEGLGRTELISSMVGRELSEEYPSRTHTCGNVRLEISHLGNSHSVHDVSFSVHAGEILALAGLVGSGRTDVLRMIFGADHKEDGVIKLDGKEVTIRSPRDAIAAGICLLTEDRKMQGLILNQSASENFALPNLQQFSRRSFINDSQIQETFQEYIARLGIKIPDSFTPATNLSGGNQQKVVLAKWLERNCDILFFDEPTRGIDVGARHEIYLQINALAAQGKSIVIVSSDLSEVIGMADRILVMHDGRITGELDNHQPTTQEEVMQLAIA